MYTFTLTSMAIDPSGGPNSETMICGLNLHVSLDTLAVKYLATIQAIAQVTRLIIERMNDHDCHVEALIACAGGTKSELFLREQADVTGHTVLPPEEPEAVLLGAEMLGATACGGPSKPR